ncbi:MAG: translation elongation factor Ts [Gemmatimonadaceae bacterium]|nr:translation elongation factor Ts [Gemmatimonadaceae bacterium]
MSKPITAREIADLRARTGAGMMDCKKALEEAEGDAEKAIAILRTKGITKAEKRAGRAASEGRIVAVTSSDGRSVALVEVNSETDFVSRNDEFGALAQSLAVQVHQDDAIDHVVLVAGEGSVLGQPFHADPSKTVDEVVKAASAKTGENVVLRRYARFVTGGALGSYVHFNHKVAALVEVTGAGGAEVEALAKEIAEHVAAGVPRVPVAASRADVPASFVASERAIFEAQAKESGKPDAIVAKMVEGRIAKLFGEIVLPEQPWVRDDSQTIQQRVDAVGKSVGATLTVRRFVRFQMGEE